MDSLPVKETVFEIVRADFIGATDDGIAFEGLLRPMVPCIHGIIDLNGDGHALLDWDDIREVVIYDGWCESPGVGNGDAETEAIERGLEDLREGRIVPRRRR